MTFPKHCAACGRGLSQKHRASPEDVLLLVLFDKPAGVCQECAMRMLAAMAERGVFEPLRPAEAAS